MNAKIGRLTLKNNRKKMVSQRKRDRRREEGAGSPDNPDILLDVI